MTSLNLSQNTLISFRRFTMKVYTVDAEQVIFHTITVFANNEEEASERVNEIIQQKKHSRQVSKFTSQM